MLLFSFVLFRESQHRRVATKNHRLSRWKKSFSYKEKTSNVRII